MEYRYLFKYNGRYKSQIYGFQTLSTGAGSRGGEVLRSFSPDILSGSEVNGAWPRPWGTLPFKSAANLTPSTASALANITIA